MRTTARTCVLLALWCASGRAAPTPPGRKGPARPPAEERAAPAPVGGARDALISAELEALLRARERKVAEKRRVAIALVEQFLVTYRGTPEEPELLFQLAELRWEEARAAFLTAMAAYQEMIDRCARERCREPPRAPSFRLDSSDAVYRRLIEEYPRFRKIDAVRYLYGFSLREQGNPGAALVQFRKIIDEHPRSRFIPDAWMAVAESRFYRDGDYRGAFEGYQEVLKFPDSALYDLALFKTAWCMWKLGDPEAAARRFKEVLDLGQKEQRRTHHTGREGQKRLRELQSEALDYLVQIFTEDERKGPKEAHEFLSSIGGAQYSRMVLGRLGEVFQAQARYARAIETERFLVELDPLHLDNPRHQARIVAALRATDDGPGVLRELRHLVEDYGPESSWAQGNRSHPTEVEGARADASGLLREVARELHGVAQSHEKSQRGKPDLERYERAAQAYALYLQHFEDEPEAVDASYLLGDIEFFKRGRFEAAGDAYLWVGRSDPPGKLHREALLNAIAAYEKVHQAAMQKTPGVRKPLPSDRKMGEAIDRYAELFPRDKEIAGLLYKNGELFYAYGDYDEAVKRFGLIVEKYPRDPAAAAAGDKILESLGKAKDYANVEAWARRLLKTPAFKAPADQDRLGKLVIDAGFKAGEQLAEKEPLRAAAAFRRVATEFPGSARAPMALANAASLLAGAGRPEEAVVVHGELLARHPQAKEAPEAAWTAAKLYEQAALWEPAARHYELVADTYRSDGHAPDALYNAGILREHLGQPEAAIARFAEYARRHRDRDDAGEVAFRVGVVLAGSGKKEEAAKAFLEYAGRYKGARAIEAMARAGAALLDAGADRRAAEPLERAVKLARSSPGKASARSAAHALYLLGEIAFRDYERIQLEADPRRLRATLERKSRKLEEARGRYLEAVALGDPEWATGALYRIGDAYERFARVMRTAPVPKELAEAEQQVYREELEKVVVVVEEKALEAYQGGYRKALALGVYNEFTHKLRQGLGRLNDQEFPPENEVRAGHAPAEAVAAPSLVERVIR